MTVKKRKLTPICPYCGRFSELVTGAVVYPHRPDLKEKSFYQCAPCDAYVGCHPGTQSPLGRLANSALRQAKSRTHRVFDRVWKEGHMSRGDAYAWLAKQMGIEQKDCHIGMMDVALCNKATSVAMEFFRKMGPMK